MRLCPWSSILPWRSSRLWWAMAVLEKRRCSRWYARSCVWTRYPSRLTLRMLWQRRFVTCTPTGSGVRYYDDCSSAGRINGENCGACSARCARGRLSGGGATLDLLRFARLAGACDALDYHVCPRRYHAALRFCYPGGAGDVRTAHWRVVCWAASGAEHAVESDRGGSPAGHCTG